MSRFNKYLIAIVLFLAAFAAGRVTKKPETDVKIEQQVITIRDTLRVLEPVETVRWKTREVLVQVRDTLRLRDTLMMALPEERATYQGEDYRAVVSGIRPRLEEIDVFPKTVTITQSVEVPGPQRWRRVGFGIAAGPGVFWDGSDVKPGAGIVAGVRINF